MYNCKNNTFFTLCGVVCKKQYSSNQIKGGCYTVQKLNRKKVATKILLILISILSIILIKEGINNLNSSFKLVENMGGFDIFLIDSSDTIVQGWYYEIIVNILFILCPIIVLILSVVSIFIKNRVVEIAIITQTFLMLLLEMPANFDIVRDVISYYPYVALTFVIASMVIAVSAIKKKSLLVFYIIGLVLLLVKYINVYKFWFGRARGSVSLLSWFDMNGIKYAVVAILGFCILILKSQKSKQPVS